MTLEQIEIPTIHAETLLLRPDGIGEFPGMVFLTDIWGIRPANIGMANLALAAKSLLSVASCANAANWLNAMEDVSGLNRCLLLRHSTMV